MQRHLITTKDGSHSIFAPEFDEHYHSIHGAIQESKHVFIEAGLKAITPTTTPIQILEMGLGTGLNAFLTYLHAQQHQQKIQYTALEAYPIPIDLANSLNYLTALNATTEQAIFETIHQSDWETPISISPHFQLTKQQCFLEQTQLPPQHYHLIYFDAFAPSAQPELWTAAIFQKLYDSLQIGGLLTTYCAKGVVKRTLKKVGFQIESLPGPPGKREMTRGRKVSG